MEWKIEKLSQLDVLHSSSDGNHMLLSVSPQSKFIISFLVLMLMASWTLRFQYEVSEVETVASSQVMWWSCSKTWTVIPFLSSNLFTACLLPEKRFSVFDLSHLRKLRQSPDKEFHTQPLSSFSWYWVFHLHQCLSHCSQRFEDNFQLGGTYGLFNILWYPFHVW